MPISGGSSSYVPKATSCVLVPIGWDLKFTGGSRIISRFAGFIAFWARLGGRKNWTKSMGRRL